MLNAGEVEGCLGAVATALFIFGIVVVALGFLAGYMLGHL